MNICEIIKDTLSDGGILEPGSVRYTFPGWKTIPSHERGKIEGNIHCASDMLPYQKSHLYKVDTKKFIKKDSLGIGSTSYWDIGIRDAVLIRAKAYFNKINAMRLYSIPFDASFPAFNIRIDKVDVVREILNKYKQYLLAGDASEAKATKEDEIAFVSKCMICDEWPEIINRPIAEILEKNKIIVPEKFRDYHRDIFFENEKISPYLYIDVESWRKKNLRKLILEYSKLCLEPEEMIQKSKKDLVTKK